MKVEYINAKQILSKNPHPENWFGVNFNINIYRGCQHGCIYCDSRSNCYQIENFDSLIVKRNAPELLENILLRKRRKVVISTGSMSDPYIPAEKHILLTNKILRLIIKYKFPFHIVTKSDLILRDLDLLKEINKIFLSTCLTITTCNDQIAAILEPRAPTPTNRLKALEELSRNGLYTGVLFQPILPFLLDTEENVKETIYNIAHCGGKFVIPWFAVTMRKGQKEYFLTKLGEKLPAIKAKYIQTFQYESTCQSPNAKELLRIFDQECEKHKLISKMHNVDNFHKQKKYEQLTFNFT